MMYPHFSDARPGRSVRGVETCFGFSSVDAETVGGGGRHAHAH